MKKQVGGHSDTKAEKKGATPETVIGEDGSAKRNIIRKGGKGKYRKENTIGGLVDDGSNTNGLGALDRNDPLYDSEDEYDETEFESSLESSSGKLRMKLTEYKKSIEPLIQEYFVNGDLDEVLSRLQEIDADEHNCEFVKKVVNMSLDKGDREKELVSQLLSQAYPDVFSTNVIGKGFERLFELADELEKDAPAAREVLARFVARCVVDEVLPPAFLSDAVVVSIGGSIVDQARRLLSRDHCGVLLERGWGPGDGRPVEELKIVVDQLLLEFLLSSDFEEASRCIAELKSPQFHHEVVKRAVVTALDKNQQQQAQISALLKHGSTIGLLSNFQIAKGFNRLYGKLSDLVLDTPNAKEVLDRFVQQAVHDHILPAKYTIPTTTATATIAV